MGQIILIWTPKAKTRFKEVYDYLLEEWSYRVANNFKVQTLHQVDLLAAFPEMGMEMEDKEGLRKLLVSSQNYLLYRYTYDTMSY